MCTCSVEALMVDIICHFAAAVGLAIVPFKHTCMNTMLLRAGEEESALCLL